MFNFPSVQTYLDPPKQMKGIKSQLFFIVVLGIYVYIYLIFQTTLITK